MKLCETYLKKGETVGFALSKPLIHWSIGRGVGSISIIYSGSKS